MEWSYVVPIFSVYMIKKLLNLYFSHRKTLFGECSLCYAVTDISSSDISDQELSKLHEEKRRVVRVS